MLVAFISGLQVQKVCIEDEPKQKWGALGTAYQPASVHARVKSVPSSRRGDPLHNMPVHTRQQEVDFRNIELPQPKPQRLVVVTFECVCKV